MDNLSEQKIKNNSPLGRTKILIKDFTLYGLLIGISKFSVLLLLPILTRFLSEDSYGMLDTIILVGNAVAILIIIGQDETIGRFIYDYDLEKRREILSTALLTVIATSAVIMGVGYLLSDKMLKFFTGSLNYLTEFRLVLIYAPLLAMMNLLRSICRWTFNKKLFYFLNTVPTITILVLTFIFVAILGYGVKGAIYAQILPSLVFSIIALIGLHDNFKLHFSAEFFKPLLKYGSPVMIAIFISSFFYIADKFLYIKYFGEDTLGIYSLASRYATFISMPLTAFTVSLSPIIFATYKEENAPGTIQILLNFYVALFAIILFVQTVLAKPVITLISSSTYVESSRYFLPIALSLILEVYSVLTATGIELSKKTYVSSLACAAGVLFMIIIAPFLVKIGGPVGIAYSVLAGRLLTHIIKTVAARKFLYHLRPTLIYSYLIILMSYTFSLFIEELHTNSTLTLITTELVLFVFLLLAIWTILFNDEIRDKVIEKVKSFIPKRKNPDSSSSPPASA